ncbi:MAG TPA: response regulator transcription factor [Ignavibacteria bacterium]|nr:response regulator transcription factor [Ignavibacteria bacterium]
MKVTDTQRNITCIIVDDEREALDRLQSLLGKFDFVDVIDTKTNADAAIKAIVEKIPDLVFVDVEMPRKSGFDVIKEVREQNVNPKFIFVTGYDQYAIKAIKKEAYDYLLKPVDIDDLKETLERYCKAEKEKHKKEMPQTLAKRYRLTTREIEIVELLMQNKTSKEIGEILFISKNTVDTHRRNILEKLGVKSTTELLTLIMNL